MWRKGEVSIGIQPSALYPCDPCNPWFKQRTTEFINGVGWFCTVFIRVKTFQFLTHIKAPDTGYARLERWSEQADHLQNQMTDAHSRPITLADLGREPFRVLFPIAVLAGMLGVAVWPLHFAGWGEYPMLHHARLMASGFFGGFILGFLGTALPRMLSAPALGIRNTLLLAFLHLAMVIVYATGHLAWGDSLFAALLIVFVAIMAGRFGLRKDTPPPGSVLVVLGLLCAGAGTLLALWQHRDPELRMTWVLLQRLLGYQGFVLLPILGAGPYLLPRFFGRRSTHDFPEMVVPHRAWWHKAALALGVGLAIIVSFFVEILASVRWGYALRFLAITVYVAVEFPWRMAPGTRPGLGRQLRLAFVALMGGYLILMLFPTYRTALLHVVLMGGFAGVAMAAAAWVVYGHSGQIDRLRTRHRWLMVTIVLFWAAMVTRISGDFWTAILVSHYVYAALLLLAAICLWAGYVLPKVLRIEDEGD
jgi:uncharacterized protein involved in response to NO